MQGHVTVTPAGAATIHTYTAPETGWRANSHVIELASQVVLLDPPLTPMPESASVQAVRSRLHRTSPSTAPC